MREFTVIADNDSEYTVEADFVKVEGETLLFYSGIKTNEELCATFRNFNGFYEST